LHPAAAPGIREERGRRPARAAIAAAHLMNDPALEHLVQRGFVEAMVYHSNET